MSKPYLVTTAILLTALTVACGGGSSGDDGAIDAATTVDGPPLEGERYTLTYGPSTVQPGQEDTRCVTLRLDNPQAIKVRQVHNVLSSLSHHLIVYRDNAATQEQPTPTPCQPFAGTLNVNGTTSPIMITQRAEETLTLPEGVAYTFQPNQFIRLEMHYINTGDAPIDAAATVEFYAVPDSTIQHEADFLFIGSPDIDFTLQPGGSQTLDAYFPVPSSLDGINYFAITGHTHHFGTDMNVWTRPSAGGAQTVVYDPTPFSWSEPETTRFDPPFTVPTGGGFQFQCSWTNSDSVSHRIQFGESANDEMCFFWAYYYPSRGAKVCVHTDQFGGQNLCCPDAGATICNAIAGQL
ncbi:MAG: hypothetical protein HS111_05870 [Kofleriaceae bacterium]|nr:hypothetical protein [Kofleriaceae bacterium]MCL4225708.1 hypothetical protein [Myxococcales bacterium]